MNRPKQEILSPQERALERLQRLMAHMAAKEKRRNPTLHSLEVLKKNDKETQR